LLFLIKVYKIIIIFIIYIINSIMKIIINYKKPIFDDNSKITGFELFNKYIIENKSKKGGDIFDDLDEIIVKK